ncbi:GIY-YIG nuclease family protein [Burkholderia cenocepacia]|uniref:GIY-YIG nuclease family protein n=1 Tax=Burkholderia cenocepacia TaxID=95486 RepID=UPI002AB08872|nr:GIY-YIG nuclease family protein [Burkholderia cenocepacia]
MNKQDVVRRILELADQNGGTIGFHSFTAETGINQQSLRKQVWFHGWNPLLEEIGLPTKQFATLRITDETITAAVAELIVRLNRWPTEDELIREKKLNATFPNVAVIRRVKKSGRLWEMLRNYYPEDGTYAIVRSIGASHADKAGTPATDELDAKARVIGYVYLLRSGKRYKIGFTNSPVRRFREVRIELPEETVQVHTIATDDPKGIEAYWHNRFAEKRVRNSEWFELSADDVRAFKRRTYQ